MHPVKILVMALGTARAAPWKPKIKLSQVPSEYEAFLSPEQKPSSGQSPSEPIAVMALTAQVDCKSARRKRRRTSNWCMAVDIIDRGCGYELREHWEFDCRNILGSREDGDSAG